LFFDFVIFNPPITVWGSLIWRGEHLPGQPAFPPHQLETIAELFVTPRYRNRDFLHQKYVIEGLSIKQISDLILSSKDAVFDLKGKGMGLRQIARTLTQLGIPTKCRDKAWHPEMVKRVMRNNL